MTSVNRPSVDLQVHIPAMPILQTSAAEELAVGHHSLQSSESATTNATSMSKAPSERGNTYLDVSIASLLETASRDKALRVDLSHRSLSSLQILSGRSFPYLSALVASHNRLTHINSNKHDGQAFSLPNLLILDLSHNNIIKISGLEELSRLRELNLSYNKIAFVENLEHMHDLEILDLAHNRIAKFTSIRTLSVNQSLRELILEGNALSQQQSYKSQVKYLIPQLVHLDAIALHHTLNKAENCKSPAYESEEEPLPNLSLLTTELAIKEVLKNLRRSKSHAPVDQNTSFIAGKDIEEYIKIRYGYHFGRKSMRSSTPKSRRQQLESDRIRSQPLTACSTPTSATLPAELKFSSTPRSRASASNPGTPRGRPAWGARRPLERSLSSDTQSRRRRSHSATPTLVKNHRHSLSEPSLKLPHRQEEEALFREERSRQYFHEARGKGHNEEHDNIYGHRSYNHQIYAHQQEQNNVSAKTPDAINITVSSINSPETSMSDNVETSFDLASEVEEDSILMHPVTAKLTYRNGDEELITDSLSHRGRSLASSNRNLYLPDFGANKANNSPSPISADERKRRALKVVVSSRNGVHAHSPASSHNTSPKSRVRRRPSQRMTRQDAFAGEIESLNAKIERLRDWQMAEVDIVAEQQIELQHLRDELQRTKDSWTQKPKSNPERSKPNNTSSVRTHQDTVEKQVTPQHKLRSRNSEDLKNPAQDEKNTSDEGTKFKTGKAEEIVTSELVNEEDKTRILHSIAFHPNAMEFCGILEGIDESGCGHLTKEELSGAAEIATIPLSTGEISTLCRAYTERPHSKENDSLPMINYSHLCQDIIASLCFGKRTAEVETLPHDNTRRIVRQQNGGGAVTLPEKDNSLLTLEAVAKNMHEDLESISASLSPTVESHKKMPEGKILQLDVALQMYKELDLTKRALASSLMLLKRLDPEAPEIHAFESLLLSGHNHDTLKLSLPNDLMTGKSLTLPTPQVSKKRAGLSDGSYLSALIAKERRMLKRTSARREVLCTDPVKWLRNKAILPYCVITAIPHPQELGISINEWKDWLVRVVRIILGKLKSQTIAIIYIQDILQFSSIDTTKVERYVDSSFLCTLAAKDTSCDLLWHKIFLSEPLDSEAMGTVLYSHMLCYGNLVEINPFACGLPDVTSDEIRISSDDPAGYIGLAAAMMAFKFIRSVDALRKLLVLDLFCGNGSILAVANAMGFDCIGIEPVEARAVVARSRKIIFGEKNGDSHADKQNRHLTATQSSEKRATGRPVEST